MSYLFVAGGLVLLFVGGEVLVRGSVSLAERLGISKLVIGLTVVSIGTSAPELVVSVKAALAGVPGLALGNVVGSNIANILLVLGLPAIIFPIVCDTRAVRRDGTIMVLATMFFILLAWLGTLRPLQGASLIVLLFGFLSYSYLRARRQGDAVAAAATEEIEHHMPRAAGASLLFILIGITALVGGSALLVDGAADIANKMGVPDTVIGITLVALGTSLPELSTGIIAAIRRHGDVAIGNAIGSNLFNILGIMGTTALIAPIEIDRKILHFDLWIMLACTFLLFPFAMRDRPIGRITGGIFVLGYIAYVGAQFLGMSSVMVPHVTALSG